MERKNGLIYDFCADGLGDTVMERFESLFSFLINIGSSVLSAGNLDLIVGKEICALFENRLSHLYSNANFNLPKHQLHFVGRFNKINLFASDLVGDYNIHVDLITRWQRITVKGI